MIMKYFKLLFKIEVRLFSFLHFPLAHYPIDQTQNLALNEREIRYQSQIEEHQAQNTKPSI
jgi:hypothetical protein